MTILSTPGSYASAHFNLFYVVNDAKASNPATYPNYKYIADVYVNGVLINRLRKFPNPVNLFGIFDIGAIVRSYIQASFNPASGAVLAIEAGQTVFNASIQVNFGEEYGVTTTYNIVNDTSRKVFNYYARILQDTNTPLADFANKIATNQYLSNDNLCTVRARIATDFLFINYFSANGTAFTFSVVGNSTYTVTITPAAAYNLLTLNISPVLLNALQPGIITSALDYYTVTIGTQTFRVNLFCEAMYKTFPVHFFNQWGGFETALFNKVSRENIKVDKKSFGVLPYRVAGDGSVNYRSAAYAYYESDYNYATTFSKTMILNSDLLTDKEYIWLEDLIESPLVYVQMLGYYYPVKIANTDYEIRKQVNETELSNLTLSVDLGKSFNSQFR